MVAFGASAALMLAFNLALIGLFASTYTYIRKMERTGCACAAHPWRKFVGGYPLFAMVYLVLTLFVPFLIPKSPATAVLLGAASIAFTLGTVVFFVMSIKYVEFLVREKCKCSEDLRREFLYYWSIFHLALIALLFVVGLLGIVLGSSVMAAVVSRRAAAGEYGIVANTLRNPIAGVRSLPGRLKSLGRR